VQAVRGEPLAPGRHGEAADPEPFGDGDVGHAIRREQHDLGAQRVAARGLPPPRPSLQLAAFGGVQGDPDSRAPRHPSLSDLPPGQRITASQPCIDISGTGHSDVRLFKGWACIAIHRAGVAFDVEALG
jgi:hypothetical protein